MSVVCIEQIQRNTIKPLKTELTWNQHSQMRLNLKYEPNWIDGLLKENKQKKSTFPKGFNQNPESMQKNIQNVLDKNHNYSINKELEK